MPWRSHLLKFAVLLLLLTIVSYKFIHGNSVAGINEGKVLCEGRVSDMSSGAAQAKFIIGKLRCLGNDVMKPVAGRLRLTVYNYFWFLHSAVGVGDTIRFQAQVKPPRDFKNFGNDTFETYALARGISGTGYVNSPRFMIKVAGNDSFFGSFLQKWRGEIRSNIRKYAVDKKSYEMIAALVLGDKGSPDSDLVSDFRLLGIIHLLVVSGLHVGVLAMVGWGFFVFVGFMFSFVFGQRDVRPIAAFFSIILVWIFVALTNFQIPAVRSGILVTVFLCALLFKRNSDAWDCLALSALIILLINPMALFDVSFQLTFFAVAGILLFRKYCVVGRGLCGHLHNALVMSAGAFAGVFPLLAYYFGSISILSPVVSTIVSPPVTFILVPLAMLGAIIPPILAPTVFLAGVCADIVDRFAQYLDWSYLPFELNIYFVLAIYLAIVLLINFRNIRSKKIVAVVIFLFVVAGSFANYPFGILKGKLVVAFPDVGQGSSVVIRLPSGSGYIIDGGGSAGSSFDMGKSVLLPFIKKLGIKTIDRIILTHPHPDHFGGLTSLLETFKPKVCILGVGAGDELDKNAAGGWTRFLETAYQNCGSIETPRIGSWEDGGVKFSILSPPEKIPDNWNANSRSVVLKIAYGSRTFLIPADAEMDTEKHLIDTGSDLAAYVLQVPHHGSSTSSSGDFLDAVHPKYAIAQAGFHNRYGFPKTDIVEEYKKRGIELFRTDINGAVVFVTDGDHFCATPMFSQD